MDPKETDTKNVPQADSNPDAEKQKIDAQVDEQPKAEPPKSEEKLEEAKPIERPVHTIPLSKYNEDKEKAAKKAREEAEAEFNDKIEQMRSEYEDKLSKANPQSHDDIVKLAEEYGYSAKDAEFIAKVIEKRSPKVDTSKYDKILEQQNQQALKSEVDKEFEDKVSPIIQKDFPGVTAEHLKKIKEVVTTLAFTDGYNTYRLEDIYAIKKGELEFKNGFSAEAGGGRSSEIIDFEKITPEQEHELAQRDPEAFKRYIDHMRSKQSRFIDN